MIDPGEIGGYRRKMMPLIQTNTVSAGLLLLNLLGVMLISGDIVSDVINGVNLVLGGDATGAIFGSIILGVILLPGLFHVIPSIMRNECRNINLHCFVYPLLFPFILMFTGIVSITPCLEQSQREEWHKSFAVKKNFETILESAAQTVIGVVLIQLSPDQADWWAITSLVFSVSCLYFGNYNIWNENSKVESKWPGKILMCLLLSDSLVSAVIDLQMVLIHSSDDGWFWIITYSILFAWNLLVYLFNFIPLLFVNVVERYPYLALIHQFSQRQYWTQQELNIPLPRRILPQQGSSNTPRILTLARYAGRIIYVPFGVIFKSVGMVMMVFNLWNGLSTNKAGEIIYNICFIKRIILVLFMIVSMIKPTWFSASESCTEGECSRTNQGNRIHAEADSNNVDQHLMEVEPGTSGQEERNTNEADTNNVEQYLMENEQGSQTDQENRSSSESGPNNPDQCLNEYMMQTAEQENGTARDNIDQSLIKDEEETELDNENSNSNESLLTIEF